MSRIGARHDIGLQAERTALAWSRTAAAVPVNGLLVLRAGLTGQRSNLVGAGVVLLLGAAVIHVLGARRRHELLAAEGAAAPPARLMGLCAGVALLACLFGFAATAHAGDTPAAAPHASLVAIPTLDLPRYMGTWTEIARYPNRFQKQCSGPAVATYSLLPEGTVRVVNRCPQADGKVDEAVGEARRVGPLGSAQLQVRFAPAWLSWLPMVWGNYWVVELDEAYQLAVVSEPTREYLWVLSRQPNLSAPAWAALTLRLQAMGFEPARLLRTAAPP